MTVHQLRLFPDTDGICPRCGYRPPSVPAPVALSPAAALLLKRLPAAFKAGDTLPIARVASLTGYSPAQAHRGLVELALMHQGVTRQRTGHRKHVYIWTPTSLSPQHEKS